MKSGYSKLAVSGVEAPRITFPLPTGSNPCPRVTRTKLACVLALVFVFALVLVLQCMNTRLSDFCCPGSKTASTAAHAHVGSNHSAANASHKRHWKNSSRSDTDDSLDILDFEKLDISQMTDKQLLRKAKMRRRFPQLIIIGVRKGGTRALLEFLNLHPSIVAEKAEMHFFDDDEYYRYGLEWYRRKMPFTTAEQITIEKTPAYFTEEAVPSRVYRMNQTCKFLLVIRDPTERAISDYTQIYFNKIEKGKPFDTFEEMAVARDGTVNKSYKAIRRSMYYKHMERWLGFFPLSQFHIVDGARLVSDPVSELAKVEDFMGVPHRLTRDRFYYNSTRGFYCMKLEQKEKCLAKSKGRTHPSVNPQVVKILHKFFKPMNQKFYSLTHRDFGWPAE